MGSEPNFDGENLTTKVRFGVKDEIINTRLKPVSLIINLQKYHIYNILKHETIGLDFMLLLDWILCYHVQSKNILWLLFKIVFFYFLKNLFFYRIL